MMTLEFISIIFWKKISYRNKGYQNLSDVVSSLFLWCIKTFGKCHKIELLTESPVYSPLLMHAIRLSKTIEILKNIKKFYVSETPNFITQNIHWNSSIKFIKFRRKKVSHFNKTSNKKNKQILRKILNWINNFKLYFVRFLQCSIMKFQLVLNDVIWFDSHLEKLNQNVLIVLYYVSFE